MTDKGWVELLGHKAYQALKTRLELVLGHVEAELDDQENAVILVLPFTLGGALDLIDSWDRYQAHYCQEGAADLEELDEKIVDGLRKLVADNSPTHQGFPDIDDGVAPPPDGED